MKVINRLKKTRRPFTHELYYIYEVNGTYQFRDSITHMVISTSSSLGGIRNNITKVINRYKNYDSYLHAVKSLSEASVSDKDRVKREKEYKKKDESIQHIIREVIKEYYLEQEEKKDFKKTRTFFSTPTVESSPRPKEEVIEYTDNIIRNRKKRKSRL